MVGNTAEPESEFSLFGRFSSAFSHVVRGHLSVITNEVSYLATCMPSEELDRVKNRCSQMAATISKIAGLNNDVSISRISVSEFAHIFGIPSMPSRSDHTLAVDRIKIERLALILRQMFDSSNGTWAASIAGTSCSISRQMPLHTACNLHYVSWSAFAARELGERSVIDAVVADLIMRAHGWRVSISSSEHGTYFMINIPLSAENRQSLCCS